MQKATSLEHLWETRLLQGGLAAGAALAGRSQRRDQPVRLGADTDSEAESRLCPHSALRALRDEDRVERLCSATLRTTFGETVPCTSQIHKTCPSFSSISYALKHICALDKQNKFSEKISSVFSLGINQVCV